MFGKDLVIEATGKIELEKGGLGRILKRKEEPVETTA